MNASISVVCYKSKTLANGENPLMLQVSKDGKRKYKSLGISVNQNYWDFKKNRPKANCPDGDHIQQIILNKVTELQKQVLNYGVEQKEFTAGKLLNDKNQKVIETKVGDFFQKLITQLESEKKVGSMKIHKEVLNSIRSFSKESLNYTFSDIDVAWLTRYEKWQRTNNNKETTIGIRFRTLRAAYNKATKAKEAHITNYPFEEFKVSKFNTQTKKRAISKSDMIKIIQVDVSQEKPTVQLSKDLFLFSYLCSGINFSDMANLQPMNINDNKIEFARQKTGKKICATLMPDALQILSKYESNVAVRGYYFPIYDKRVHKTAQQKQYRINKVLGHYNKGLKRIAELCEIKTNLTSYVARHSFATVLKNSGVNISLISEALGHSDLSTTQIYLDSFESSQVNEAMKNLL